MALAADWNLLWHEYRNVLPRYDLILTDGPGAEVMQQAGFTQARAANLFGLEQAFLEPETEDGPRDIDILFVGNLHPAVQHERLAWLARMSKLSERWKVHIATGVFGDEYRKLVRRSRIVFNRSIRGECNKRVFEAPACGAMLFQETENREIRQWLTEGQEFVAYDADNLEERLEYYLTHEEERRAIAEAGRAKARACTFENLWTDVVEQIGGELPTLNERVKERQARSPVADPPAPAHPILDNLIRAEAASQAQDRDTTLRCARQAIADLERLPTLPESFVNAQPWRDFDFARVEWERAAWSNAGNTKAELQAKHTLLRWRLHLLAADASGDQTHYYEAVLARPDLPVSRAALGCAQARAGRLVEARVHLDYAVKSQPFDRPAARALGQVLQDMGDLPAREQLVHERRLLSKAAPGVVPMEDWFTPTPDANGLVSIIILCCSEVEVSRRCLESVHRHTRQPYELIIIDNGSTDSTPQLLDEVRTWADPVRVEVIRNDTNRGYGPGVNQGIASAKGEFLVLLNNDTVVTPQWLDTLITVSIAGGAAALVGPVSNYAPEPQFVPAGYVDFGGLDGFAATQRQKHFQQFLEHPRLTGFCLLVPRVSLDRIGNLDERFETGFFEDDDLCVRARQAGIRLRVALEVYIHHEGSKTFRSLGIDTEAKLRQNFERFREKWGNEYAAPYRMANAASAPSSEPPPPDLSLPEPIFAIASAPLLAQGRQRRSLTMIVKNEEENLADCLTGVRHLVDEMIIVDTGSTDRTKEIALQLGAKVYDFPWVDNFAAARNEALKYATGQWIFWMDGDDRLDEPNQQKLARLLDSLDGTPAGHVMKCRCVGAFQGDTETVVHHVRLFPNDPRLRWRYRVHEQMLGALRDIKAPVHFSDVEIQHVGYLDPQFSHQKVQRNLRLLLLDHVEKPDDPFILFNLGSTYQELRQPEQALPYIQKSLQLSDPADSIVRKLYSMLARAYREMKQPTKAVAACAEGRAHYPEDPELLLVEGWSRGDVGDLEGAKFCLRRLIEGNEPGDHFASVAAGLRSHMGRNALAQVLMKQKKYSDAEVQWRIALTECPKYLPAIVGLADLYLEDGKWEAVEQLAVDLGEGLDADLLRGRIRLKRKEYGPARFAFTTACDKYPNAISPRVFLSYALLQEGKDLIAAEKALRDILAMDPTYQEARNNLEVLLRQQNRHVDVE